HLFRPDPPPATILKPTGSVRTEYPHVARPDRIGDGAFLDAYLLDARAPVVLEPHVRRRHAVAMGDRQPAVGTVALRSGCGEEIIVSSRDDLDHTAAHISIAAIRKRRRAEG